MYAEHNTPPKISCSLLAAAKIDTYEDALESVKNLESVGIDYIHYDISDHKKTLNIPYLNRLLKEVEMPFDVHIANQDLPDGVFEIPFREKDKIALQVEHIESLSDLKKIKSERGCEIGLALKTTSGVEVLKEHSEEIDFVLLMAAEPGVSGGSFDEGVLNKIDKINEQFPKLKVTVDGGVNDKTSAMMKGRRVDSLVSGSYIFKGEDYSQQMIKLLGESFFQPVSASMRARIPSVHKDDGAQKIASEISTGRLGCVCVLNNNGEFEGFITDGDLRRKLIESADLRNITAKEIMVTKPFTVSPESSLIKILRVIEANKYKFSVVPVIDKNTNKPVGILALRTLLFINS